MASLRCQLRVEVVRLLRMANSPAADLRWNHAVPILEWLWITKWFGVSHVRLAIAPGMVMMVASQPERSSTTPVRKVAALLDGLGDVSGVELKPTEERVLREIQKGERVVTRVANAVQLSIEGVRVAAFRIARLMEREMERRERDAAGVPFEARPLADLRLKWPAERLLGDLGITTIGQLLQWSYADLLRVRRMGVGRLRHINERLWLEGKRTLAGSEPPPGSDDRSALALIPASMIGATSGASASIDMVLSLTVVSIAVTLAARWANQRGRPAHRAAALVLQAA